MKEICLELIKAGRERLKYPIISIYIIVLVLWNWEVISYYLLSDDPIKDKILYIETNYHDHWGRILWPLLKAIILAILIPTIMLGLEYVLSLVNGKRREIKYDNNDKIRGEKLKAADVDFKIQEARTGTKTIQEWENKVAGLQLKLEATMDEHNQVVMSKQKAQDEYKKEIDQLNNKLSTFGATMMVNAEVIAISMLNKHRTDSNNVEHVVLSLMHVFELVLKGEKTSDVFGVNFSYEPMSDDLYNNIYQDIVSENLVDIRGPVARLNLAGLAVYGQLIKLRLDTVI